MRATATSRLIGFSLILVGASAPADAAPYWNVFNIEGESTLSAQFATYDTLNDAMFDTNRLGVFTPSPLAGENIVGAGSDGTMYWNVFNIEGESALSAQYATYGALMDMLLDTNRLGVFTPGALAGNNIIGSGSDGSTYWNVFNIENESVLSAQFATYSTLGDMLLDANRLGVFTPSPLAGANIVGSGSDGSSYWNVFNIEGESTLTAQFATYSTLMDMLLDANRIGVFTPSALAGANIVGSGAAVPSAAVPEPATLSLLGIGLAAGFLARRRRTGTRRR